VHLSYICWWIESHRTSFGCFMFPASETPGKKKRARP
jgi:hypothetical protein